MIRKVLKTISDNFAWYVLKMSTYHEKKRAGSGKKDRRLSENSALLDALMMRPSRRAGYETTQTESRGNLQGQGGDSGLARR
jgi:hypothetical protein